MLVCSPYTNYAYGHLARYFSVLSTYSVYTIQMRGHFCFAYVSFLGSKSSMELQESRPHRPDLYTTGFSTSIEGQPAHSLTIDWKRMIASMFTRKESMQIGFFPSSSRVSVSSNSSNHESPIASWCGRSASHWFARSQWLSVTPHHFSSLWICCAGWLEYESLLLGTSMIVIVIITEW